MRVLKYPLQVGSFAEPITIQMYPGAKLLRVYNDRGTLTLDVLVFDVVGNPEFVARRFRVLWGDASRADVECSYVGSVNLHDGRPCHLFELA